MDAEFSDDVVEQIGVDMKDCYWPDAAGQPRWLDGLLWPVSSTDRCNTRIKTFCWRLVV